MFLGVILICCVYVFADVRLPIRILSWLTIMSYLCPEGPQIFIFCFMYAITICFDSSILQVMDLIFSAKELFPVPSIAKKVNA